MNRSECIPFAFRVYATYEVNSRLSDLKLHAIIDKLNPDLRSVDEFNGQKRVREFYAMKPEEAYAILEAMAEIHDCKENLKLVVPSDVEAQEEQWHRKLIQRTMKKRRSFHLQNVRFLLEKKLEYHVMIQVLSARLLGTEKWSIKGKKCR